MEKFQQRYRQIKSQLNKNAVKADRDIREKVYREKNRYAEELSGLERKNIEKIESVKKDYVQEKNDALARADREFRNAIEGLRNKLDKKYYLREDSLQRQIADNDYENTRIVQFYEKQMGELRGVAAKEFDRITELAEGRREMDRKEFIRNIRDRDREFKNKISNLKKTFDNKIAMSKLSEENRTRKLVDMYENMLANEKKAYQKEILKKNELFRKEYERLADQLELKRESLVAQYEAKIEKMQRANS